MFSLRRRFSSLECLAPKTGSGTILWQRHGTERVGSSPGLPRKTPSPETSHTAPVTPLHESNRRRSPVHVPPPARTKASSTPQLLDGQRAETSDWPEELDRLEASVAAVEKEAESHGSPAVASTVRLDRETGGSESVLQKFRKSLSLRFQASASGKKGSKESFGSEAEADEEEPEANAGEEPRQCAQQSAQQHHAQTAVEQKHKFGSLIWRSSKEKKKLSKSIRSAKCNSGDSGIQLEMAPGCGGFGDSSESHDTDPLGDELDSPPLVRRRRRCARSNDDDEGAEPEVVRRQAARPHSELVGQVFIDKFKADLKYCPHPDRLRPNPHHQQQQCHRLWGVSDQPVRRTRSDLGARTRRSAPERGRRPTTAPPTRGGAASSPVAMRAHPAAKTVATTLRRSLSQPVDIDKIVVGGADARRIIATDAAAAPSLACTSSEDEARTTSNSESSLASLPERRRTSPPGCAAGDGGCAVLLAEAVFDHVAIDGEELAFRAGDVVRVLDAAHDEWWWGTAAPARRSAPGWFPANSVRLRAVRCAQRPDERRARAGVVAELAQTERDFVAGLVDVVEGYLGECRRRRDMFDDAAIAEVFGNVEELLGFQRGFLADLEACVDAGAPHQSRLGGCFLRHRDGFKVYSEYCNSRPVSTAALQELYRREGYREFFEACRLMRGLTEIPLDGHLLTPVQRICKYPLQLAELLKYTRRDHPDYDDVREALEAMRGVAVLINERKRRMECLEKLARWQEQVEGWEGEDVIERSTQLIHQGEVVKVTTGMWTNNITLFLFDHQILYCKKDILKRNSYVYKGRISLDNCEVVDLPNGKDLLLGVSMRHAIRLSDRDSDRFLVFCCRSSKNKQRWLRAFAEERRVAEEGNDPELELPAAARRLAKIAARCERRPPTKLKDSRYATDSLGRRVGKVGNWFGFKKSSSSRQQQQRHLHDVP